MVKSWAMAMVLTVAVMGVAYGDEPTPEPAAKVVRKFEYAELSLTSTITRVPAAAAGAAVLPAAGPGVGLPPGAAGPGGAFPQGGRGGRTTTRRVSAPHWVTGSGTVEAKTFTALATKLKLPAPKKELSEDEERIRVLNHLGSQGWELVSGGLSTSMTFKREIAK